MTDFDFIAGIGWRDVVLVVAALIGVYLALLVMRLFHVAAKRPGGKTPDAGVRLSGWEIYPSTASQTLSHETPTEPVVPAAPEQDQAFARELAKSSVEVELERLRREGVHLRHEVSRLADEVAQLKASRNVSPLYNEAMTLAQKGMPAEGIAGRCGISIGEAELVASLARSGSEFERHERNEERDERNTDSGNRHFG